MDHIKFKLTGADQSLHEASLSSDELLAMASAGNPVAQFNAKFGADQSLSVPAFDQAKTWFGLARPDDASPFGNAQARLGDVLDGRAGFQGLSTQQNATPIGTASRAFINIAVVSEVTSEIQRDRSEDPSAFESMIANTISVAADSFERPVLDWTVKGSAESAKASRVVQGAEPPKMAFFKTSDRIYRIPSWNIGMEWSEQALRNTTLDYVTLTLAHFLEVEREQRVYDYVNALFNGNNEMITGAVSAVTSASLDAASTGGVLTHKAFLKFLARNRRYRKITHLICDLDTYLKIEGRSGRPGSNNYDPSLVRIDPQVNAMNVGFGNDVKFMLVDSAAEGGPVPANTIYAIDASRAVTRVVNTQAAFQGVAEYAMRRTTALRLDWSEAVFRTFGDTELRPFDVLTIS